MTDTNLPVQGKLKDIMPAEAKIAMPEVVAVFISKYETDLYNEKDRIQTELAELSNDVQMLQAKVHDKIDFSKYEDIKVAKLDLVSFVPEDSYDLSWRNGIVTAEVYFKDAEKKDSKPRDIHTYKLGKTVSWTIPAQYIADREKLKEKIQQSESELQDVLAKLSDMSRKERQVKARISELRLQEQGLEGFLNDEGMQKLISIK